MRLAAHCALDCPVDTRGAAASPRAVFIPVSAAREGLVAVACRRARRFSMEKREKTSFLEFCTEVSNFFRQYRGCFCYFTLFVLSCLLLHAKDP